MVSLVTGACRDLKWDKLIKNPRSKNDSKICSWFGGFLLIGCAVCWFIHQDKTGSEAYLVWKERVLNCGLGAGVARGPVAGTWAWVMSRSALWPPTPGAQSPATSHTQTSTGAHLGCRYTHCVDIIDIASFPDWLLHRDRGPPPVYHCPCSQIFWPTRRRNMQFLL